MGLRVETRGELAVGVIGAGFVASVHHLPAMRKVPDLRVAAISDPDRSALERAAESTPGARTYLDPAEMLAGEDLDLVAVLAPASEHATLVTRSMEMGLPTFVEKPLALTLEEADQIHSAKQKSGSALAVGFVFRRHRLIRSAVEMVQSGRLGKLRAIVSVMTSDSLLDPERANAWRRNPEKGGGVLYEQASHHFDLWSLLSGREVRDVGCSAGGGVGTATVTATLGEEVFASGTFSDETGRNHALTLFGDDGTLSLRLDRYDGIMFTPTSSLPGDPGERINRVMSVLGSLPAMVTSHLGGGDLAKAFEREWWDFASAVRGGSEFRPGIEEGRAALAATIAATVSAQRVTRGA